MVRSIFDLEKCCDRGKGLWGVGDGMVDEWDWGEGII